MPSNVRPATPVGVFPYALSSAFTEELRLEALINTYADGSSERQALAINPRRFWKLNINMRTGALWNQLWGFFETHRGVPFYFYNLRETDPPWSYDATGTDIVGRYVVVFDGGWSDEVLIGKGAVALGLREVG